MAFLYLKALQIILIQRWNQTVGIPDIVIAMVDYFLEFFISGINSMPISLLVRVASFIQNSVLFDIFVVFNVQFVMLCPDGSEGIVYSALLSLQQTASLASKDIGTALTLVFDVDSESVSAGDFGQVRNLTLITR
jgi:hypothetical protein